MQDPNTPNRFRLWRTHVATAHLHPSGGIGDTRFPLGWLLSLVLLAAAVFVIVVAAPASAADTFGDDDGNVHERSIEALAKADITRGCDDGRFCPDRPVTRGEMAAFLVRAFDIRPDDDDNFRDDDQSIFEGDIDAIADDEITKGCNPPDNTRFCPQRSVTRAEMATFLTRAMELEPESESEFVDVRRSVHLGDIAAIADEGITLGCNPPDNDRFCPGRSITRGEMATFLARALDLPLPEIERGGGGGGGGGGSRTPDVPSVPPIEIPDDAIELSPGDSVEKAADRHGEGTAFVLKPGVYRGQQIQPDRGQMFIGLPGAVLDGEGEEHAFVAKRNDVTVAGLEIRGYDPPSREAVINPEGGKDWLVQGNEIHHNAEIGIKAYHGWFVAENHIHHNGRYGMQGFGPGVVVIGNEIAYNRTNSSHKSGDSGGTKFVNTEDLVLKDNFVHHNYGNGLWVDINNEDPLIEGNRLVGNEKSGIFLEISCGGVIRGNYLKENGVDAPFPSWIGEGTAIQVANTPGAEVYNNTLVGNGKGIGAIHWDHPGVHQVDRCKPELKNLKVYRNKITQSDGPVAGIDAHEDKGSVWSSWGNEFEDNEYDLSGDARFRWEGEWMSMKEWRRAGQE